MQWAARGTDISLHHYLKTRFSDPSSLLSSMHVILFIRSTTHIHVVTIYSVWYIHSVPSAGLHGEVIGPDVTILRKRDCPIFFLCNSTT
jgi:hypothetical protein